MNVAIIHARGGSKRIPRKNIKNFCGLPMITWSIKAAQQSNCFDQIIVSTDDDEISEVARQYGADIPFIRPSELSNDFCGTIPVIKHAIQELSKKHSIKNACCIYATAPFIQSHDITKGLSQLSLNNCSYVFPITSYPFPIQRAVKIRQDNRVEMFQPEAFKTRSQDLEEAYHDAGQFYWGRVQAWLDEEIIFSQNSIPIIIPRYRVQDIDTEEDWIQAELLFNLLKNRN